MPNTEYISNEESRFKPNYIEYMEAEEIENRDNRSERTRSSQVVETTNSAPQDLPSARDNSPNSGSPYLKKNGNGVKIKTRIEKRREKLRLGSKTETTDLNEQDPAKW